MQLVEALLSHLPNSSGRSHHGGRAAEMKRSRNTHSSSDIRARANLVPIAGHGLHHALALTSNKGRTALGITRATTEERDHLWYEKSIASRLVQRSRRPKIYRAFVGEGNSVARIRSNLDLFQSASSQHPPRQKGTTPISTWTCHQEPFTSRL